MSSTREELHRLVDKLESPALEQLAAYARALQSGVALPWEDIREALGEPGRPSDDEGDLDCLLQEHPPLFAQLRASLTDLQAERPCIPHAEVVKRVRRRR